MTEDEWRCGYGGRRKPNGNCEIPDPDDGLAVQGVGEWSAEKHDLLRRFVDATWAARSRYVPVGIRKAGAAYVDLFAGPGRVRVRGTKNSVDGSPLIALGQAKAPFSSVVLCDIELENVVALRARTDPRRTTIIQGDCNDRIEDVVSQIPLRGLNLAFVDPFAPRVLSWSTLARLGRFERMDLLVNIPIGFIKRNFHTKAFRLRVDAMMGDAQWRDDVKDAEDVPRLIEHLRRRLARLGYRPERSRPIPIANSMNTVMYYLAFFSKHGLGDKIWKSIVRTTFTGQTGWGFD